MGARNKYDKVEKPRRINKKRGDIEKFDAAARARGLTYAQAQVEETCKRFQRRVQIPAHYRRVGKRGS